MDVLVLQRRTDKRFLTAFDHEGAHWSPSLLQASFVPSDTDQRVELFARARNFGARVVRVRMDVVGS